MRCAGCTVSITKVLLLLARARTESASASVRAATTYRHPVVELGAVAIERLLAPRDGELVTVHCGLGCQS